MNWETTSRPRNATADGDNAGTGTDSDVYVDASSLDFAREMDIAVLRSAAYGRDSASSGSWSAWRQGRLWLFLTILAGIAIGTPFLLAAGSLWVSARHPFAIIFAVGGVALLLGPGIWHAVSTWRLSRQLAKEERHNDVQQD